MTVARGQSWDSLVRVSRQPQQVRRALGENEGGIVGEVDLGVNPAL